ncbi:MAG: hypothetical protein EBU84_14040 [Actinobacteria bacterium]|nr:hypothetical protein [Actinomycetota bacterium]
MLKIQFEPLEGLTDPAVGGTKDLFKSSVVGDIKMTQFAGTPEVLLQVEFDTADGSDILVRKVDPENALGYSVFSDQDDYYLKLSDSLYDPPDEEILGDKNG